MRSFLHRDPLAHPEILIRQVYAYAAYRLGHGPDAEDVTGEVFERAIRYRRSFDRAKGEPVAWLLGIARRCADDILARPREYHEPEDVSDGRSIENDTVRRLTLTAALAQLSERDRELIALRYGGDLTAAQIAELLGAQTNAIEVALHRALRRLRRHFEADDAAALRPTGSGRL